MGVNLSRSIAINRKLNRPKKKEVQSEIKPGDMVINTSKHARRRDPFRVVRVEEIKGDINEKRTRLLHVIRPNRQGKAVRTYLWEGPNVVKLEPGESAQQALAAHISPEQLCEICMSEPAPERHFVTVPFARGFTKVCPSDYAWIKQTIRERTKDIVSDVFAEAKARKN